MITRYNFFLCLQENKIYSQRYTNFLYCVCSNRLNFLKYSFPGIVFFKPSLVDWQFQGLPPFLFLLSSKWYFLCCGQCNNYALLYLSCSICCHPNQKQVVWHISETPFKKKTTTFQGHNQTQCHSWEPGCVSKPICFILCAASCSFHILLSLSFKPELQRFSGTDYNFPPR